MHGCLTDRRKTDVTRLQIVIHMGYLSRSSDESSLRLQGQPEAARARTWSRPRGGGSTASTLPCHVCACARARLRLRVPAAAAGPTHSDCLPADEAAVESVVAAAHASCRPRPQAGGAGAAPAGDSPGVAGPGVTVSRRLSRRRSKSQADHDGIRLTASQLSEDGPPAGHWRQAGGSCTGGQRIRAPASHWYRYLALIPRACFRCVSKEGCKRLFTSAV